jgi:TolB-like protein
VSGRRSRTRRILRSRGVRRSAIAGLIMLAAAGALAVRQSRTPVAAGGRTMLAVLPFANLGRPDDEYFATGLTDEITSRLAGVQRLGVISGTSAGQYKASTKSLRDIGRELGVSYVLEGSVRWDRPAGAPARVRVIPQLIRVDDDSHLWSERYDASLADLFDVQASIAEAVARALNVAIAGGERSAIAARPTDDMEAYAYYLQGNQYLTGSWGELKRLRIAVEMYGKAVAEDPRFALAYAKLSEAQSSLYASTTGGRPENIEQARAAAETAVRLEPDLAEAHLALGYYHYRGHKSYDDAMREFAKAERLQPNSVEVIQALGLLERRRGRLREGVEHLKQAAELDPRSAELASDIGLTDWVLRAYPESERYLDRAIALSPDWVPPHAQKAWLYASWQGDLARARRVIADAAALVGLGNVVGFMNPDAIFMLPDDAPHRAAFEELAPRDFEDDTALYALSKAEWYRLRGMPRLVRAYSDTARAVLEVELRTDQTLHWRRSFLGYAYAGLGRPADAAREGTAAVGLVPDSTEAMQHPFALFALARIYALTGQDDLAVQQLEYLLSVPSMVSLPLLRVDPTWQRLRGNPRFERLLAGDAPTVGGDSS